MPATNPTPILTPVSRPLADSGVGEEELTDVADCKVPVGDGWAEGDELLERDTSNVVDAT